jgi:thiaminase/transcriptional activator TenA
MEWMDDLAAHATGEQMEALTEIFVTCSRYELAFWDMSWEMRT